ncbi:TonB-dependent receptor [hydrothermal vent metagenome]|uniref:TonB-dependent receptor n=1 Tax=hydrothermal vent metagenome TaxID=652676 RepID=A0A3B0STI3_9ZZZZ
MGQYPALIALGSAVAFTQTSSAMAKEVEYEFNIPPSSISEALSAISEESGTSLLYSHDIVGSAKISGLVGKLSVEGALKRVLSGTGLNAKVTDFGVIVVTLAEAPNDNLEGSVNAKEKSRLLGGVTSIFATLIGGAANAQSDGTTNDEIIVTGIRGSLQSARNTKRNAAGIVDAIAAEDIGQLPDTNLAESLQRITGVSIDRSGGEGQFVTVRGFGPQFNTVLVNGRQIASEDLSRAFSFDTIASELVNGIQVHKSSTAMLQSGGIGSTINITTARPLDLGGFKMVANVNGAYEANSDKVTPNASGLISQTFADGKFGVLLAASYQKRKTRLDQVQSDGWLENVGIPQSEINGGAGFAGNIFSPRNLDNKVTFENRERIGATLVLQYAPSEDLTFTLDGLFSSFDNKTNATSFGHWFTAPNLEDVTVDENGTVVDLFQEVGLATDFHSKKFDRLTDTYAIGFNTDWNASDSLNVSIDAHYSKADRAANNGGGNQLSLIGYANRVRFQSDDQVLPWVSQFNTANPNIFSGQQEIEGVANLDPSDPNFEPADGVSDYLDTANSRPHVMLRRGFEVDDEVQQYKTNVTWDDGATTGLTAIRAGMQFSREKKSLTRWDNETGVHCAFCGYPDSPTIPAGSQTVFDAGDDFLSGVSGSDRLFTRWLSHDGEAQFAFLEGVSGLNFDAVRRGSSYTVKERTISGYVETDFAGEIASMPLSAVAGVRAETTNVTISGTDEPITQLVILDQTELLAQRATAVPIALKSDYNVLLPNFSLRLDVTDNFVARFAASQTITRPTLQSLSPVLNITTTRQGGDFRANSGNPDLIPFKSDNLDLSFEYYYGNANYISVGVFRKDVSNFIVTGQTDETLLNAAGSVLTDPSTGTDTNAADAADGSAVFTVARPINGEAATIRGIEAAIQHNFGDTGFGIQLNATIVDGDADLDPADVNQIFALTGLSDSANVIGFYDKGPLEVRVAWNWRDQFLQSLSQVQGNGVTIVESFAQLDASTAYHVTDNISLFFEGINLTNEVLLKRGRFSNQFLLAEESGRRFNFGARLRF